MYRLDSRRIAFRIYMFLYEQCKEDFIPFSAQSYHSTPMAQGLRKKELCALRSKKLLLSERARRQW